MNLGLAGVCNGTDRPRLSPPPPSTRNRGGPGSQELKSAQEHPRDSQRGALAEPQSLPSFHWPAFSRVSPVPSSPLVGGWLFLPQSFSSSPSLSPSPPRTGAHRLPPAPQEGRNLEKSFPEVWIRARTGRPREEGRGRREREREEEGERIK